QIPRPADPRELFVSTDCVRTIHGSRPDSSTILLTIFVPFLPSGITSLGVFTAKNGVYSHGFATRSFSRQLARSHVIRNSSAGHREQHGSAAPRTVTGPRVSPNCPNVSVV